MTITETLVGLIRDTASSLPADVMRALRQARRREAVGSPAETVLATIISNCALAAKQATPLCQDTGTLTFFIDGSLRRKVTPAVVKRAVAEATERGYLRKNCLNSVSGKSYDDNCAEGAPVIHYVDGAEGQVTLLLKGGGSENMSRQYSLPDAELGAGRDLEGVRRCVIDAAVKAQGYGCAPGILGVCVGGDRAGGFEAAKESLLRPLGHRADADNRTAETRALAKLERRLLREINSLGIGPMGLGGNTTVLDVHLVSRPRLPASFFVTVAYMCWACRRRTVKIA